MRRFALSLFVAGLAVSACASHATDPAAPGNAGDLAAAPLADAPFTLRQLADFDDPWAISFLPGDTQALVTEQDGRLLLWDARTGTSRVVAGVPAVAYAGQGGLGDVVLHPDFTNNGLVYLSWAEAGPGGRGAAVGRGRLTVADGTARLDGFQTIWRQEPFIDGGGHYGHRIAFGPDGMLYISSGERQQFDPAQDMNSNLGKVLRLTDAGGIPSDNPYYDQSRVRAQIWSAGHRNPLGLAFDRSGRLWELEMGPAGGDELNLVTRGGNYGYPAVSNGSHYDGRDIPDHAPGDGFVAPQLWWNPAISPGALMIYDGSGGSPDAPTFAQWRGNAFIAALGGQALIRVTLNGDSARQADRWDMGFRVRDVAEHSNGSIWVLEDGGRTGQGRLYMLTPR